MLPVRFRTILRRQSFSRAQSRMLISLPSRERSLYKFRMQPLPIFVILCKYSTRAILRNSETATFFKHPIAYANTPAHLGAHRF